MVESVICDQRRFFLACAYLNGKYGCEDVYLGVPVILDKKGVERIIELELDPEEKVCFEVSHQEVRESLELLKKSLL